MNIDKDDVTTVGTIIGFLLMIFGGGRAYEKLESKDTAIDKKVEDLKTDIEKKPPYVLVSSCEERRSGCARENKLQFDHGEQVFQELKKLIADNDRASNERHSEIMKILLEMNKA